MKTKQFEEDVLPKVLANELTCRAMLDSMLRRGVRFSNKKINPNKLTHEECMDICLRVYSELKYRESK